MFLNYIKDYFLKRSLKKSFVNVENVSSVGVVHTVGVLIDGDRFFQTETLVEELVRGGIAKENIQVIIYRSRLNKDEVVLQTVFTAKDFNWKGDINNQEVINFIENKFDLLINYYDVENSYLLTSTNNSEALFKVGFSSTDKRLNHLMIHTGIENYTVFIHELFRYLKILNKI